MDEKNVNTTGAELDTLTPEAETELSNGKGEGDNE